MKNNRRRLFLVSLLVLVSLAVVSTNCGPPPPTDSSGDESSESDVLYKLLVSERPSEGGTVFPGAYPGEEYTEGTQVTVTAFPKEGYSFSHWCGDVAGETNPIIVTMDSNKTSYAFFIKESDEPPIYILRASSDPPYGGHILPSIPPEGRAYSPNTKVALTAIPAEGYNFRRWEGLGWWDRYEGRQGYLTHLIFMDSDKDITAYFWKPSDQTVTLTVEVEPAEGGSVYLTDSKDLGKIPPGYGLEYVLDTSKISSTYVGLTATPNDGYRFSHWVQGGAVEETGVTITVYINSNVTVCAYFKKISEEPQDEPLPPLHETLYTSFEGEGQCTATQNKCSCNLTISFEGKDLTNGSYPVTNVTLTVNGDNWDDSGSISETHYTKTVERVVDCGETFNIEITATNSIGQKVSATGFVTTAK